MVGTKSNETSQLKNYMSFVIPLLLAISSWGQLVAQNGEVINKKALLVGIADYASPQIKSLDAPLNDVELMKQTLIGKFEFIPSNVHKLTNEGATRQNIIDKIHTHLIQGTKPGDIIVFYFSGHGSRRKDDSGDEDDRYDETLVPYDSRQNNVFDLSDDEINGLIRFLHDRKANITFILESCFSGTGVRGAGKQHFTPKDQRDPPPPPSFASQKGEGGNVEFRQTDLDYVLLSASTAAQVAREVNIFGNHYSVFTYYLTQELLSSGSETTYRDVMDRIKGEVSNRYSKQTPQLEGAALDQYVFGHQTHISRPYALCKRLLNGNIQLNIGRIHGVTKFSKYQLFPPDTKQLEPGKKPQVIAEIIKTDNTTSEAHIVLGSRISDHSRAIEVFHNYEDRYLALYIINPKNSPQLLGIQAEISNRRHMKLLSRPLGYHFLLEESNGHLTIYNGDNEITSLPISTLKKDAVRQVVNQLESWARWFSIFSIVNKNSTQLIEFELNLKKSEKSRGPFDKVSRYKDRVIEGDVIICRISNISRQDLYIHIVNLSSDGSITLIYPETAESQEILVRGTSMNLEFETFLPEGRETVIDIVKVFATTSPLNYRIITQEQVRNGQNSIEKSSKGLLIDQFEKLGIGTTRSNSLGQQSLEYWDTSHRIFKVTRHK